MVEERGVRVTDEPKGRWESPDPRQGWEEREHDAVFSALDAAFSRVDFPASRTELIEKGGDVRVTRESDLPLVKYLQGLPERRFRDADEVRAELNARWQDLRGLRGKGHEAAESGGAPHLRRDEP